MLRSELVHSLYEANPSLPPETVKTLVSVFFETIVTQLAAGGKVEMRGFGLFSTTTHKASSGVNPKTREAVELSGRRFPRFKASGLLRFTSSDR